MNEELQPKWYEDIKLSELKSIIKDNIGIAGRSFVTIGYYLKNIKDRELYLEDGYKNVWEFAQSEFGIGKSSASQFMSINDRFSVDGNSPLLLDQYKDFTSSKLAEMLTLSDEQLEQVTPVTTRTEIREMKHPVKEIDAVLHAEQKSEELITIDDLDFTVRTYNCLKRANINTINELCDLTEDKVIAIRNISRKCLDEINEKLSEIGRRLKQDYQLPDCAHEADTKCNMINIKPIAESLGMDCNGKCCWGCEELCGARCNASGHRPDVNIKPEIVDSAPEIVNGVDELDPVETVEADIIETETITPPMKQVPDKWHYLVPIGIDDITGKAIREGDILEWTNLVGETKLYQVYYEQRSFAFCPCEIERIGTDTLKMIPNHKLCSSRIIRNVHDGEELIQDEIKQELEIVKPEQPEFPILKNNDQRKEFIEAYKSWPVWIDQKLTGERYFRYDFDNGESFVIRVSLNHKFLGWSNGGYSKTEIEYSHEEYFILGTLGSECGPKEKTFAESGASKSMMVDYLKEFQKKQEG